MFNEAISRVRTQTSAIRSSGVPGTKSSLRRSAIRYFAVTVLSMFVFYHFQQAASMTRRLSCSSKNWSKIMHRVLRALEWGEEIGDTSTLEND